MGPDPAVAALRLAVRRSLPVLDDGAGGRWVPDVRRDGAVLVACSGGADSLALLSATVFELRHVPVRVIGAVVDHGLQEGSAEHTSRVVAQMAALGVDETASIRVRVDPGPRGVEAGAREARYAALSRIAAHFGAQVVLLGHTLDDQAETVLLGLTHGSGGRSIAGMRPAFHPEEDGPLFRRPLLELTRHQTEAACRAEQVDFWHDPHNTDPRFVRARIRHSVMPTLERELGPGVAAALARTGDLLRGDLDALDEMAEVAAQRHDFGAGVAVEGLETMAWAVRSRLLRTAALRAGCPPRELTRDHVRALEAMVWQRRGEPRDLDLPGHVTATRRPAAVGDVLRLLSGGDRGTPSGEGPVAG